MSYAAECSVASDQAYGLHFTCALCCSDWYGLRLIKVLQVCGGFSL